MFSFVYFIQLLLKGASERGAKRIRVHILTDGRDVLDGSSVGFVETLENDLLQLRGKGIDAQIASGGGRMYVTMDRYEVKTFLSYSTIRVYCLALWLTVLFYLISSRMTGMWLNVVGMPRCLEKHPTNSKVHLRL